MTNTRMDASVRERIFVDAFFLIALLNPGDQYHEQVIEVSQEFAGYPYWTTDWVLLEAADACCFSPGLRRDIARGIRAAFSGEEMTVVVVTPALWNRALIFYN